MEPSSWTEERIGELSRFWEEGLTTAEIGRRMGITKNAVVGKVHRLALTPRIVKTPPPRKVIEFSGPSCLWPTGHPGDHDFRFCGQHPVPGKPYCAEHAAVAYVRPKEGKNAA